MMKKTINFLAIMVLTLFMVGFAFDRIAPATPASARSEQQLVLKETGASENEGLPIQLPAALAVIVTVGITFVVFGTAAVSPLILEILALSSTHINPKAGLTAQRGARCDLL